MPKKTILEVFQSGGVIVGDGSYIFTLGKIVLKGRNMFTRARVHAPRQLSTIFSYSAIRKHLQAPGFPPQNYSAHNNVTDAHLPLTEDSMYPVLIISTYTFQFRKTRLRKSRSLHARSGGSTSRSGPPIVQGVRSSRRQRHSGQ